MPTYLFLDRSTGEIVEEVLRMSEYDKFVRDHPHFERYHGQPANLASDVSANRRSRRWGFSQQQSGCEGESRILACNCARHRLSRG